MTMHSTGTARTFTGLLAGLMPGHLQSRGLFDIVPLLPGVERDTYDHYASPLEHLKLVRVQSYGTLLLENTEPKLILIAPMHIGFFQEGAQNHATSRVLILKGGETLTADDCFCVQQSQGGLLKEAQQRFIVLPLSLRQAALTKRGQNGFGRLWQDIDAHNRRYGISRGGHLERFLRPYFHRLQPFRHAFELLPQQVGAAYFIAGQLVGLEITPNAAYWQDVGPVLNIYCYGAAALLAERHRLKTERQPLNLDDLSDLDDLTQLLTEAREWEMALRSDLIQEVADLPWEYAADDTRHGLRVMHLQSDSWAGQVVKDGSEIVYLSLFRDITV